MKESEIVCKAERRRREVRKKPELNGLDFLEIGDDRRTLTVFFLGKAPKAWCDMESHLLRRYFRIEGGRRIRDLDIDEVALHCVPEPEEDDWLEITLNKAGDFSTYRLCVTALDQEGRQLDQPHPGFDARYACLEFSFQANCPSDLDCKQEPVCPPQKWEEPEINYLAKDYASFRQLIFDRLALVMPDWKERHVPDLGVTLVELLAYVGDYLSYYQDAVATEAYLDTARRRVSVRRHVRLVDYALHEGCNARAWVTLWVSQDLLPLMPSDFYLITNPGLTAGGTVLDPLELPQTLPRPYLVFEPLVESRETPIKLYEAHNEIRIYTWGDEQCCLPKGATSATLIDPGAAPQPETDGGDEGPKPAQRGQSAPASTSDTGHKLKLDRCDVLIFEEVKGPKTGMAADADPARRHAVRLTKVDKTIDPLTGQLIVEIEWAKEDALPFPLCISSVDQACRPVKDVSVARGNVILVDHGERLEETLDEPVPGERVPPDCENPCCPGASFKTGRYRPRLPRPEITYAQPLPPCIPTGGICKPASGVTPASALLLQDPRQALPQVTLYSFPVLPDGTPAFGPADLLDPEALAKDLLDQSEPKTRYLRSRFSPGTLELLGNYDGNTPLPEGLRQALIGELKLLRQSWQAQRDLLGSHPDDRHFVVEMEEDRRATVRFGDGELGQMPEAGTTFRADYRIGGGPVGNVGAEALSRIVFRNNRPGGIDIRPRNPLPAAGGTAPEPLAEAKLFAPGAFRKDLQRAITADDYAAIVMRDFRHNVQRAAATLRWTGSWCEVLVAVDPLGGTEASHELLCEIERHLNRYRRIGHDLAAEPARYVPLDIGLTVCVLPDYLRGHVKAELLKVFGNRTLPDGRLGFFHPDNLSFGEGIYLSKLVAAAQAVEGVESVRVDKFERLFEGPDGEIEHGILPLAPLEIARLDNDPSFPENGVLTLDMRGGR